MSGLFCWSNGIDGAVVVVVMYVEIVVVVVEKWILAGRGELG